MKAQRQGDAEGEEGRGKESRGGEARFTTWHAGGEVGTRARATAREVRTCFVVKYLDRNLWNGGERRGEAVRHKGTKAVRHKGTEALKGGLES
jgi:hypothetical protein